MTRAPPRTRELINNANLADKLNVIHSLDYFNYGGQAKMETKISTTRLMNNLNNHDEVILPNNSQPYNLSSLDPG